MFQKINAMYVGIASFAICAWITAYLTKEQMENGIIKKNATITPTLANGRTKKDIRILLNIVSYQTKIGSLLII